MDARRGRPTAVIELSGEEREALGLRCRIVLAAAEGRHNNEVAAGSCWPRPRAATTMRSLLRWAVTRPR